MDPDDFDVLAYEPSPIGMIGLRRRALPSDPGTIVTEITLDHEFLMSSHSTASERALSRRALELHTGPSLDVLVGGLGLGYTAAAVLESERVARLEVVELLSPVIDWFDRDLIPLAAELRADPRFAVRRGDVFARLEGSPERRHDLVLLDVDHSPEERLGDASGSFYAEAGLARARCHLAPGGVFGLWSYAESPGFARALRAVFDEVWSEPLTLHNPVLDEDETHWLYFARG